MITDWIRSFSTATKKRFHFYDGSLVQALAFIASSLPRTRRRIWLAK